MCPGEARAVDPPVHNEVRLVGRLAQTAEERVLPSGDSVWTFRVVVPRPERSKPKRRGDTGPARRQVDALECAAWSGRTQRVVRGWERDDVVEVIGALHRRFYRTPAGTRSRFEVEMTGGRLIRRAAAG